MISAKEMQLYDDTPLEYEETMEMFYLDQKDFVGKLLSEDKRHETELEEKMPEDFLYEGKETSAEDYDWEITYQFSSAYRDNTTPSGRPYGNPLMTFRRLYIILCEKFNAGSYFIDDYFKYVYPSTMKETVEKRLENTKRAYLDLVDELHERIRENGTLDKRYKANKELLIFGNETVQEEADVLAEWVKEDIKACLEIGIIPLNFSLSRDTIKLREELGIHSDKEFFAMGHLIDDLRIFFRIRRKEWQTRQGIMV